MDRKAIQRILDYIEDNLKAEISVEELSDLAGFSLFHFYRLFQSAVGMPVMQYITRRRLLHGIHEISLGHKKIDVALSYGYETYAGFYKSFVREIGYLVRRIDECLLSWLFLAFYHNESEEN